MIDNDDNGVDYTVAMESPLVAAAAAAGYGYCCLNILNYILKSFYFSTFI